MLKRCAARFVISLVLLYPGHSGLGSDAVCSVLDSDADASSHASAGLGESLLQRGVQKAHRVTSDLEERANVKLAELNSPSENSAPTSVWMERASPASGLMPVHPKVLRSMYDKTTLFYHVHVPRTGGTTVANLLVADICAPESETIELQNWTSRCGKTCEVGLTDNMLSCKDGLRPGIEHSVWGVNYHRAEKLRVTSGAEKVVFVTSLRPGPKRLISQWGWESFIQTFQTPPGVERFSNESLSLYINGSGLGPGWIASGNYLARNNLQVATLASVSWSSVTPVTREHLEQAKYTLVTGDWMIGFTPCLDKLHGKLLQYSMSLHGNAKMKSLPLKEPGYHRHLKDVSPEVMAEVEAASALDTELYKWAWGMAQSSADERWAGSC